ncbi:MAG TPA: UDP-2,3-diacylglucosamine diphosphatase [Steroidobacteraceae bacterium]|nr:UDP-2,3-diacylglucosamine diphosphatase [Steroidobacteraceae bacterium]
MQPGTSNKVSLRSVFVSDVHLGSRDSRASELLEFLGGIEVDYLFLVGDIIDLWSLRRNFYWPQEHNEVVRAILDMARSGTKVIYVPGNHDQEMREFCGSVFGNLEIRRKYVHATAAGRELLVMHGDEFDTSVKCSRWLAWFGAHAYEFTLRINRYVNVCRRLLGLPYWSFATYLKLRLKNAVRYVAAFEVAAAQAARQRGLDGIVCGHIHRAGVTDIDGVLYCNDGDWVESCTALVEDNSGKLSLWHASQVRQRLERGELLEVAA